MSTESGSGVKGVWNGREIVSAEECDEWRERVHDGESASQVAHDVDGWGYDTVHTHVKGKVCNAHGPNTVSPATTGGEGGGLPVASDEDVEAVREGVHDALEANYGDTANVRIKSFRKNRDVSVRGQTIGVVLNELVECDPRGEFDVTDGNPDSNVGWWMVRYADGGKR